MYLFSSKNLDKLPVRIHESEYFSKYKPYSHPTLESNYVGRSRNVRGYRLRAMGLVPFIGGFSNKNINNTMLTKYMLSYKNYNSTTHNNNIQKFYKQFAETVFEVTSNTATNIDQSVTTIIDNLYSNGDTNIEINITQSAASDQKSSVDVETIAKVASSVAQQILGNIDQTFKNHVLTQADIGLASHSKNNFITSLLGKKEEIAINTILGNHSELSASYASIYKTLSDSLNTAKFTSNIETTISNLNNQHVHTEARNVSGHNVNVKVVVSQTIESLTAILKKCNILHDILTTIDQTETFGIENTTLNSFDTNTKTNTSVINEEEEVSSVFKSIADIFIAVAIVGGVLILGYLILKFVK